MKLQFIVSKVLLVLLAVFVGFFAQTAVFSHFALAGVLPNVLVTVTSMLGFMRGRKAGALCGFACGLLCDLFSGDLFGTYAMIFVLVGYLNGLFKKLYFGDNIRLPLMMVALSDLVYGGMVYFSRFLFRSRMDTGYYFLNVCVPEMVYTVLVAILLYFPMYKLDQLLVTIDKRSVRHSA